MDDDGRGIPTGVHAKSGLSGVELVLTRLHAGGKFGGSGYKTSGGLHGVGASAVNALSHRFDVTVKQSGKVHQMSFAHGVPGVFDAPGPKAKFTQPSGLQLTGKMKRGESSGTSIRYWYDARYFETGAALDVEAVRAKLRNTAFLVPGVTYVLRDGDRGHDRRGDVPLPATAWSDMVDFLTPSGEKPVCGTLLITGEGTYKENAADAERRHAVQSGACTPRSRWRCAGAPATSAPSSASPTRSATCTAAPTAAASTARSRRPCRTPSPRPAGCSSPRRTCRRSRTSSRA